MSVFLSSVWLGLLFARTHPYPPAHGSAPPARLARHSHKWLSGCRERLALCLCLLPWRWRWYSDLPCLSPPRGCPSSHQVRKAEKNNPPWQTGLLHFPPFHVLALCDPVITNPFLRGGCAPAVVCPLPDLACSLSRAALACSLLLAVAAAVSVTIHSLSQPVTRWFCSPRCLSSPTFLLVLHSSPHIRRVVTVKFCAQRRTLLLCVCVS